MYSTWNLKDLKAELKKRNANVSGRKADLIERLEAYDRNFNFGNIATPASSNTQMLLTPNVECYRDVNSSSKLPKVTKYHIQTYFDRFSKNISDAVKLYESRYLLVLRSAQSGLDTFVKGYCKASMKNLQYEVNVKISNDGMPEETSCECAAGVGIEAHCKHVAVVLLGVENMSREKMILLNEVTTQKLQSFHKPSKKYFATPLRAENIPSKRDVRTILYSPYLKSHPNFDKKSYEARFRNLIINFSSSSMPIKQIYKPANTYGILNDHHLYSKTNAIDTLLQNLNLINLSQEKIDQIEMETRGQSKNQKWHEQRKVHLTASIFHTICHLRTTNLAQYANQVLNKRSIKTKAMAHGLVNEQVAIKKYSEKTGLVVKECGLLLSLERPYLGASPDGLLGDETVIEVKCPYASRYYTITPKTVPYLIYNENNELTLKKNNIYYYQIQGQLYVSGRNYCNLIIFTFKSLEVIFIDRDDMFISNMLQGLDNFYNNYFKNAIINKYYHKDYDTKIKQ